MFNSKVENSKVENERGETGGAKKNKMGTIDTQMKPALKSLYPQISKKVPPEEMVAFKFFHLNQSLKEKGEKIETINQKMKKTQKRNKYS